MKRLFKKLLTNTVFGTTIVGILFPSCSSYIINEYNAEDNIYGTFAKNGELGILLVDINTVEFSSTFKKHIKMIEEIIQDVTSNKDSAILFCSDTDAYLAEKGYIADIQLSPKEKSIIKALTDDDVQQALKKNDFKLFLTLCKQKGYISKPVVYLGAKEFEYTKYFKTENDYLKFLEITSNLRGDPYDDDNEFFVLFIAVFALVYYVGCLDYYHMYSRTEINGLNGVGDFNIPNEPVLKFWIRETSKGLNYDLVHSELILNTANEYVTALSEVIPEIKKEALKELLIVNLENYYGLTK